MDKKKQIKYKRPFQYLLTRKQTFLPKYFNYKEENESNNSNSYFDSNSEKDTQINKEDSIDIKEIVNKNKKAAAMNKSFNYNSFNKESNNSHLNLSSSKASAPSELLPDLDPAKKPSSFFIDSNIKYYIMLIGISIGYGAFWRFPYLVFKNGGGVYIIIYSFLLFVIGVPIFYLETYYGQVFRKGPVEVFTHIHKKFSGLGWSMVIVTWMLSIYYATLVVWALYFLFNSFYFPLPWSNSYQNSDIINLKNDNIIKHAINTVKL